MTLKCTENSNLTLNGEQLQSGEKSTKVSVVLVPGATVKLTSIDGSRTDVVVEGSGKVTGSSEVNATFSHVTNEMSFSPADQGQTSMTFKKEFSVEGGVNVKVPTDMDVIFSDLSFSGGTADSTFKVTRGDGMRLLAGTSKAETVTVSDGFITINDLGIDKVVSLPGSSATIGASASASQYEVHFNDASYANAVINFPADVNAFAEMPTVSLVRSDIGSNPATNRLKLVSSFWDCSDLMRLKDKVTGSSEYSYSFECQQQSSLVLAGQRTVLWVGEGKATSGDESSSGSKKSDGGGLSTGAIVGIVVAVVVVVAVAVIVVVIVLRRKSVNAQAEEPKDLDEDLNSDEEKA